MSLLVIRGLSAGYGPLRVLHDLDLDVEPGERVGLVGLNGHGKSTLLQAIVGLTGWQAGSILLDGIDLIDHGTGRRDSIGHPTSGLDIFQLVLFGNKLHCDRYQWLHGG